LVFNFQRPGYAELTLEAVNAVSVAVLDTKALTITGCTVVDSGLVLAHSLSAGDDVFGQALTIQLGQTLAAGQQLKIRVAYSTSPTASAIQWLPPAQTSGKVHPYLFTQCQAIHCRSLAPVQDSPYNKFPYTADLTVPAPLVALMSAKGSAPTVNPTGTLTYHFSQPVPMPSYLVAMAVGALESREIGPRSRVWSEKETVDAGAYEFAETEQFIQAAEAVCGPYVWGHYDVLLLPPSFPYGGMENPCLIVPLPASLRTKSPIHGWATS
jgi:leukotriene-A4 hydrolase